MRSVAVALLIASSLFGGSFAIAKQDQKTACELDFSGKLEKSRQTSFVYDLTDRYNDTQLKNIISWVQNYKASLSKGERLNFFTFDKQTGFHASVFKESFCVAGNPPWIVAPKNLKIVKRNEDERISEFFNSNNPTKGTSGSPIIDAVISASRAQDIIPLASGFHLVLISDLVEYSNFFKLNDEGLPVGRVDSLLDSIDSNYKFPISDVQVTLIFVQRPEYRKIQSGSSLELLWVRLMKKFGAAGEINVIRIN